jgi:hypothetical protein
MTTFNNYISPFRLSPPPLGTFSTLALMKTKTRNRLMNVEENLRVACSKIHPRISTLMKTMQAHTSH